MASRSLKADESGIVKAEKSLTSKGWSRAELAEQVVIQGRKTTRGIDVQTVHSFFTGKSVDRKYFTGICKALDLNWEEIIGSSKESISTKVSTNVIELANIDAVVRNARQKIYTYIQDQCGTMRILDMTQPIGLKDIYTSVNILDKITGRRRLGITELLEDLDPDKFDRPGLGSIRESRIPGLVAVENHPKLMILGKPGSGKTTFLKYLAIQCISGNFQESLVPIFITLKDFAETLEHPSLVQFIKQLFKSVGVTNTEADKLLKNGRLLILLDGLDEVRSEDNNRTLKQIKLFSGRFFFSDIFKLDQADFLEERDKNIKNAKQPIEELNSEIKKIEEIKKSEDQKIKSENIRSSNELDRKIKMLKEQSREFKQKLEDFSKRFPDLSGLKDQGLKILSEKNPDKFYNNSIVITCRIAAKEYSFEKFVEVEVADFDKQQIADFAYKWFQAKLDSIKANRFIEKLHGNPPIQELATNPLLLTLLCLIFEEASDFPANRAELYKEGLDVLMKKWDSKRNIERDQVYKRLSLQRKEDLLSKIAFFSFEKSEYFLKQSMIEWHINDYIRNLPDASTVPEALQLDSEAILQSIEAQHGLLTERARGIYSFSHLTFQEYFTARKIVSSPAASALKALQNLACHITEKRWREVFLLTVEMLPSADDLLLLIKHQIDGFLANSEQLQLFLDWINQKSLSIKSQYTPSVIRAFYFDLAFEDLDFSLTRIVSPVIDAGFLRNLEIALNSPLNISQNLPNDLAVDLFSVYLQKNAYIYARVMLQSLGNDINPEIRQELLLLKEQLPASKKESKKWWDKNHKKFIGQFILILNKWRNVRYEQKFDSSQIEQLKQYREAYKLLVDCLSSDCYVNREVRIEIEDNLFLPIIEINKRGHY